MCLEISIEVPCRVVMLQHNEFILGRKFFYVNKDGKLFPYSVSKGEYKVEMDLRSNIGAEKSEWPPIFVYPVSLEDQKVEVFLIFNDKNEEKGYELHREGFLEVKKLGIHVDLVHYSPITAIRRSTEIAKDTVSAISNEDVVERRIALPVVIRPHHVQLYGNGEIITSTVFVLSPVGMEKVLEQLGAAEDENSEIVQLYSPVFDFFKNKVVEANK